MAPKVKPPHGFPAQLYVVDDACDDEDEQVFIADKHLYGVVASGEERIVATYSLVAVTEFKGIVTKTGR